MFESGLGLFQRRSVALYNRFRQRYMSAKFCAYRVFIFFSELNLKVRVGLLKRKEIV